MWHIWKWETGHKETEHKSMKLMGLKHRLATNSFIFRAGPLSWVCHMRKEQKMLSRTTLLEAVSDAKNGIPVHAPAGILPGLDIC